MGFLESLFEETDEEVTTYPGSKRPRRSKPEPVKVTEDSWDAKPLIKTVRGKSLELFKVGDFAKALGRPVVTIRRWERLGYIPTPPFRSRPMIVDGQEKSGQRLYTRAMVEYTVRAFEERNLVGRERIDWSTLTGFSIELFEAWKKIQASDLA